MPTTQPSRIFANGPAKTLYVTIPAGIVADSQFPFQRDDSLTVTIDDDRLIIAPDTATEADE